jgi:release factor glutamine methyltransferase
LSPTEVLRHAARYLAAHGVESPEREAEVLMQHVLRTGRAGLYARREGLSSAEARDFGRALCRRCTGIPVQHLVGDQPFMDLILAVEPGVFVPRPETEILVEAALDALDDAAGPLVVDVGTGTGAIALAVKEARPDAHVLATDVSAAAVTLAGKNAVRLGLDVEVRKGAFLDTIPGDLQGRLDLLVSNPPYVSEEEYETLPREVKADPYVGLVGGTAGHRALAGLAPIWLKPGGWLVVEIGSGQALEVGELFAGNELADVRVLPDLAGRDRVVRGRRPLPVPPGR